MLLAVMLPTAWGFASQKVTVIVTGQGSIVADKSQASEGEQVTLTISSHEGWMLKRQTLLVEQVMNTLEGDGVTITRSAAPVVGSFVPVTKRNDSTYTFTMPSRDVEVCATFVEYVTNTATIEAQAGGGSSTTTTDVTVDITIENETGHVEIGHVTVPDNLANTPIAIIIPAVVNDTDGNTYPVTSISTGAFQGNTNITDIYLPDTDKPLYIEEGASLPTIHTPLSLLDDYALMPSLSGNYAKGKICAQALPAHRYWTFSCGVDIELPQGVKLYIVKASNTDQQIEIVEVEDAQVIKANNGVLLACPDHGGNAFEMVVRPSVDRPSGTKPATENAHSYSGNLLEPVIVGQHYATNAGYYILYNNEFHPIMDEDVSCQIPACKAVLHLSE